MIVVAMVAIAVFDKLNNNNNIHSTYIKYSNNIRQLYLMDVVFAIVRKRCRSWSAIVVAIHRQSLCVSAAVANVYIYTNLSTYILFENWNWIVRQIDVCRWRLVLLLLYKVTWQFWGCYCFRFWFDDSLFYLFFFSLDWYYLKNQV